MNILGISGYYHDSAAALVLDGELIAAAQEERFSRIKGDEKFPALACVLPGTRGIDLNAIDLIAFYDKPLFTRSAA